MPNQNRCPQCGAEITSGAPAGQCPRCMMGAGFESEDHLEPGVDATGRSTGPAGFEAPAVDELGKVFPQLEILELVGKGGMGAVYKARQPRLDRIVALKVLPQEVGRDPAFAERFTREARAMARLSHPNIVAIHDFGQVDGLFYFVMEFVDGANLRQAIGNLQPHEALAIVPQICDALQFAHDEGIVHRDIKPENVLIDTKGRVKIADFGLAKLLGQEQVDVTLTHTNQVMGTLRYMAPEQMQRTHGVDHRADIYSLGVVFYELLTGTVPVGSFDPPSKKVQIDVRLDEVVLRALAQEPDKRYQQASQVKTDVEMLVTSQPPPIARQLDSVVPREADLELARHEVKVPAIGLMVVGVLTCLTVVPFLLVPGLYSTRVASEQQAAIVVHEVTPSDGVVTDSGEPLELRETLPSPPPPQVNQRVSFLAIIMVIVVFVLVMLLPATGAIIAWGGWKMLHLKSHVLALTAAILALVPCQPLFILGWVFGIWSLVVLNRPHIRAAFASNRRPALDSSKDPKHTWQHASV